MARWFSFKIFYNKSIWIFQASTSGGGVLLFIFSFEKMWMYFENHVRYFSMCVYIEYQNIMSCIVCHDINTILKYRYNYKFNYIHVVIFCRFSFLREMLLTNPYSDFCHCMIPINYKWYVLPTHPVWSVLI